MPLTPQSRIKAFVEEAQRKTLELISGDADFREMVAGFSNEEIRLAASRTDYGKLIADTVNKSVIIGLELGREAGPDGMLFAGGSKTCELHKEYKCEGCDWWNSALTAKNQAITDLIESIG